MSYRTLDTNWINWTNWTSNTNWIDWTSAHVYTSWEYSRCSSRRLYELKYHKQGNELHPCEREEMQKEKKATTIEWHKAVKTATRIAVFDFDDTIIQSAKKPEKGDPRYGWNGKDWWGSEESLSPPLFHLSSQVIHQPVIDAIQFATNDPNTFTILLTGRRGIVAHKVREHLRHLGLYGTRIIPDSNKQAKKSYKAKLESGADNQDVLYDFHRQFFQFFCGDFITEKDYPKNKKGKPQHGTIFHKTYVIQKLMHEGIQRLEIWDDRDDHIRSFIALSLDLKRKYDNLTSAEINRVFPIRDSIKRKNCTILNIPIKSGMSY